MESLPRDAVLELLRHLHAFVDLTSAFVAIPQVRLALDCPPPTVNSLLIPSTCDGQQLSVLRYLNVKWNLQAPEPLTFPLLRWNYKYSYQAGIRKRMTLACQNGDCAKLFGLLDEFAVQYNKAVFLNSGGLFQRAVPILPLFIVETLCKELCTYGHPNSARQLIDSKQVSLECFRLIDTCRARPTIKAYLTPHKLFSARQIRQDNFEVLYSPDTDEQIKQTIWSQQYRHIDLPTLDDIGFYENSNTVETDFWEVIFAKFNVPELMQYYRRGIVTELAVPVVFATCNLNNIEDILREDDQEETDDEIYSEECIKAGLIQLIKRGYWDTLTTILIMEFDFISLPLPDPQELLSALSRYSLTDIDMLLTGLIVHLESAEKSPNHQQLLRCLCDLTDVDTLTTMAIRCGNWSLLREIRSRHKIDPFTLLEVIIQNSEKVEAVQLMSELLADISNNCHSDNVNIERVRKLLICGLYGGSPFYSVIWAKYGREQLEASLRYLQSTFGFTVSAWFECTELGLLEYMLRYRLNANDELTDVAPGMLGFLIIPEVRISGQVIRRNNDPKQSGCALVAEQLLDTNPDMARLLFKVHQKQIGEIKRLI